MNRFLENAVEIAELEGGYVTLFRLLMIRDMVNHRGFTNEELADAMGCSPNWVSQILSGRLALRVQDYTQQLDRVEDAITYLTDMRGALCACSESSKKDVRAMLGISGVAREVFGGPTAA